MDNEVKLRGGYKKSEFKKGLTKSTGAIEGVVKKEQIYAKIDEIAEPPMFWVTPTHCASTWLLDDNAPKVEMPKELRARIDRMLKEAK